MNENAREVLSENLKRLMTASAELDSRAKIAKKAKVALGAVSNMTNPDPKKSAPSLRSIEKVAKAYGLAVWQLMYPGLELTNPPVAIGQVEKTMYDRIRDSVRETMEQSNDVVKQAASKARVSRLTGRYSPATLFNDGMQGPESK